MVLAAMEVTRKFPNASRLELSPSVLYSANEGQRTRRLARRGTKSDHMAETAKKNKVALERVQCQELESANISNGIHFTASSPSCLPKSQRDGGEPKSLRLFQKIQAVYRWVRTVLGESIRVHRQDPSHVHQLWNSGPIN